MTIESKVISVIIPCYNAEKYISETIHSVLNQTYQNFEIIVIDDESKDNSGGIVKKLAQEDNRIVYHFQKNKGMCATRNVGLTRASGEYILFLDNDDVIEKSFLEDRYIFLESHPEVGLCGSEIVKIDSGGKILPSEYAQHAPTENMLSEILLYKKNVASIPSNLLIRNSLLKNNKINFNEMLSSTGDKYFLIQLANVTKSANIKAAPIKYRIHSDSMSSTLTKGLFDDNELFFKLIQKNNLIPEEIKKRCVAKNYYILGAMAYKLGNYSKAAKYLSKLSIISPSVIFNKNQ